MGKGESMACLSPFCRPVLRGGLLLVLVMAATFPLSAQYNADRYFTYLDNTFNEHDKSLQSLLVEELTHFLTLFPEDPNAGRVQYMLASVYREKGQEKLALAHYLKMLMLYPNSGVVPANKDDMRAIIANERAFRDQKDWLEELVDQDYSGLSTADAYIRYIPTLLKVESKGMREAVVEACREFFRRFSSDSRNDQVVLWMAEAYLSSNDHREANNIFAKFTVLFPNSPQLANVLFKQGELYYREIRNPEKAIELLSRVVSDYPDSASAGNALFTIAEIKDEKQKDYKGAVADYQLLVAQYPANAQAVEGLWRAAQIRERRLEDYPGAVELYGQIVEKYPADPRGIEALEKMADIYEDRLSEYALAAESLAKLAEFYPTYEKVPERLIAAGEICEKRLNDAARAVAYYQMVVDKFPGTDRAKDAAKKIEKAQQ